MGTIYCVNFDAISLFAISRQPLICSYGWIQTVDTIILPARLILSPKRTFSVCCAWALLVQPADLDILMLKTRIVTNTTANGMTSTIHLGYFHSQIHCPSSHYSLNNHGFSHSAKSLPMRDFTIRGPLWSSSIFTSYQS
jgi:hypothetical protein